MALLHVVCRWRKPDSQSQYCRMLHEVYTPMEMNTAEKWQDDKKHGKGIQVWKKSGAIYRSTVVDGKMERNMYVFYILLHMHAANTCMYTLIYFAFLQGYGTYFYNSSAVYEGEWSEDQRSGWGRMYYGSGDIYEGEWMKDKTHGQGIIRFANGNWYEGTWRDGKKNGNGKFYYPDKGQLYEGFWVDGVAKCGTLSDFGRDEAPTPTKYPIPQVHLVDMQLVLREAQSTLNQA
ncbi:MORN repeat-containing protein 3 [Collichthys lucidus]|uniref:MORN repeat-containing protein 3 n=1 Tax=Collichthys lucidus TaxID=240159 RepID=A0A4U5V946_COLLU|nr:MORN repeat-containing protein 3 [Collichthys lucidus]